MSKTVLITGASRGIGAAIAEGFAKEGYDLILVAHRSADLIKDISKTLAEKYGVSCTYHIGDIGDPAFVNDIFSSVEELDVLVNNAGISHIGLLQDMTDEEWHRLMATNLDSVFYTCRAAIPIMLKKHSGHIINISSAWGLVGAGTEVAYSASKGALNSFTKALGKELAPSSISVNAIACGVIDTEMNSFLSEDEKTALIDEIPAGRMGTPEEVAETALLLANAPTYLTGQIIGLDGGWI